MKTPHWRCTHTWVRPMSTITSTFFTRTGYFLDLLTRFFPDLDLNCSRSLSRSSWNHNGKSFASLSVPPVLWIHSSSTAHFLSVYVMVKQYWSNVFKFICFQERVVVWVTQRWQEDLTMGCISFKGRSISLSLRWGEIPGGHPILIR